MRSKLLSLVPLAAVLRGHRRADYASDAVAGATTAVMLVPQAMAYAMLAGLPPVVGLYASIAPLLAYALFGTSRQLAVGPVAMVSLMVATSVGALAAPGTEAYLGLAIALAAMVGLMQLGMGVLRLGFLTNFLAHPVISGFTSAAALIIAASQLKHLFGLSVPRGAVHQTVAHVVTHVRDASLPTLVIGGTATAALIVLGRLSPRFPRALAVVASSAVAVYFLGLGDGRVSIVGQVPSGLPSPSLPPLDAHTLGALWPTAAAISLVGFMESVSVAKAFARRNRYEIDSNRELVGLGLANLAGSLFSGYPVTGGFSRTAVNAQAGARSGLASMVTAVLVAATVLLFTPLLRHVPQAALAAVIVSAVIGLIDVRELTHLWRIDRLELGLWLVTFAGTLSLGIEEGIALGVALSLAMFVVRTMRPHTAILGRLPEEPDGVYRNVRRHESALTTPSVVVLRIDARLYFGNVEFLKERFAALMNDDATRAIVLDASAVNFVDASAVDALEQIHEELTRRGIALYVANAKGPVQDTLERAGLVDEIGRARFFRSVAAAHRAATALAPAAESTHAAAHSTQRPPRAEHHPESLHTVADAQSASLSAIHAPSR